MVKLSQGATTTEKVVVEAVLERSMKDDKKPAESTNSKDQNLKSIGSTIEVLTWDSRDNSMS